MSGPGTDDDRDPFRRTPGVPESARIPGWQPPALSKPRDSVFVLARMGRLPSWYLLPKAERAAIEREHVDLMLDVGDRHGLRRLEAFRLITQQGPWVRFWVIEFPTLEGAEAWIEAEMAPRYGLYGSYEYHLARAHAPDHFTDWVTNPAPPITPWPHDPRTSPVPPLDVDRNSIVVLLFGRGNPGYEAIPESERDDEGHIWLMKDVARRHGLMRIEAYALMDPAPDYHRAWVIEWPDLAGAEAWIENEVLPPHGIYARKAFHLARRWAPEYAAAWVRPENRRT